jgi:Golgi SNAP receptor complex protein 1
MATYDSLHRQCRTLESLFDSKLTSYARLAASISRAGTNDDLEAGPSWREAESEVEDLLEKVCLLLSAFLALDEPRRLTCEFDDGSARRNEFGVKRCRSRH